MFCFFEVAIGFIFVTYVKLHIPITYNKVRCCLPFLFLSLRL